MSDLGSPPPGADLDTIDTHVPPAAAVPAEGLAPPTPVGAGGDGRTARLGGLPLGIVRYFHRDDAAGAADNVIDRYLSLVQRRDRGGADAMLCGSDDTGLADLPGMNQPNWHPPPVESFTVVRAWDWSSVIDGHVRGYRVRLLFADRSAADVDLVIEVIGDRPCIATRIPI